MDQKDICRKLHNAGYEAYLVGGCVRDKLMGVTPHDYDICTNATTEQIHKVFPHYIPDMPGEKYGTVIVPENPNCTGELYEVTTYRKETSYSDSRHPDAIECASRIEEDLKRRDFTMNAIAFDPISGNVVDPFNGIVDIKHKIIRAVGDPEKRINEDGLRIMRAVRFSSTIGFMIEPNTLRAMEKSDALSNVSEERKFSEIKKMLLGKNCLQAMLLYKEFVFRVIPELKAEYETNQYHPYHIYNVYEHTVHAIAASKNDIDVRMALLLHDLGKPESITIDGNGITHFPSHRDASKTIAETVLTRMHADKIFTNNILALIANHDILIGEGEKIETKIKRVKKFMSKYDYQLTKDLICVIKGDVLGQNPIYCDSRIMLCDKIDTVIDNIQSSNGISTLKTLDINGYTIRDIGFSGPGIGKELDVLLDMVIGGEIPNDSVELKKQAERDYRM